METIKNTANGSSSCGLNNDGSPNIEAIVASPTLLKKLTTIIDSLRSQYEPRHDDMAELWNQSFPWVFPSR